MSFIDSSGVGLIAASCLESPWVEKGGGIEEQRQAWAI
jgi:hypothetical protein